MSTREILRKQAAKPASDGDGVRLLRVFGGTQLEQFDPFLMLDEFGSDQPEDYLGGFPPHPHRGFETVTYMLNGRMEHRDHLGNVGVLDSGGVQWMTAGSGIIHSEMPLQQDGLMHGFQLWVNLPAAAKMKAPSYRDIPGASIPRIQIDGCDITCIAGDITVNQQRATGFFAIADTAINFFDIALPAGKSLTLSSDPNHRSLLYTYQGAVAVGANRTLLKSRELAVLGTGSTIQLTNSGPSAASILLLSGAPIGEPIVQYGPFVMNTKAEIEQALEDYRRGVLAQPFTESDGHHGQG
jgi:quercetin 2,3-dioxygenase